MTRPFLVTVATRDMAVSKSILRMLRCRGEWRSISTDKRSFMLCLMAASALSSRFQQGLYHRILIQYLYMCDQVGLTLPEALALLFTPVRSWRSGLQRCFTITASSSLVNLSLVGAI